MNAAIEGSRALSWLLCSAVKSRHAWAHPASLASDRTPTLTLPQCPPDSTVAESLTSLHIVIALLAECSPSEHHCLFAQPNASRLKASRCLFRVYVQHLSCQQKSRPAAARPETTACHDAWHQGSRGTKALWAGLGKTFTPSKRSVRLICASRLSMCKSCQPARTRRYKHCKDVMKVHWRRG